MGRAKRFFAAATKTELRSVWKKNIIPTTGESNATDFKFLWNFDKIYFNDDEKHHIPHFRAEYGDESTSFDFEGNILAGSCPPSKTKLVSA